MPVNAHCCHPLVHSLNVMKAHKCNKSCHYVCKGDDLNKKLDRIFKPDMDYQVCATAYMKFIRIEAKETCSTIPARNTKGIMPTIDERLNCIFSTETKYCKSYRNLSRSARFTRENAIADLVLSTVVSKYDIKGKPYNYILQNRIEIATNIAFLLDIIKVHLQRLIKENITMNTEVSVLPVEILKQEFEIDKETSEIIDARHNLEEEVKKVKHEVTINKSNTLLNKRQRIESSRGKNVSILFLMSCTKSDFVKNRECIIESYNLEYHDLPTYYYMTKNCPKINHFTMQLLPRYDILARKSKIKKAARKDVTEVKKKKILKNFSVQLNGSFVEYIHHILFKYEQLLGNSDLFKLQIVKEEDPNYNKFIILLSADRAAHEVS